VGTISIGKRLVLELEKPFEILLEAVSFPSIIPFPSVDTSAKVFWAKSASKPPSSSSSSLSSETPPLLLPPDDKEDPAEQIRVHIFYSMIG
jgi:hypothetical protein